MTHEKHDEKYQLSYDSDNKRSSIQAGNTSSEQDSLDTHAALRQTHKTCLVANRFNINFAEILLKPSH